MLAVHNRLYLGLPAREPNIRQRLVGHRLSTVLTAALRQELGLRLHGAHRIRAATIRDDDLPLRPLLVSFISVLAGRCAAPLGKQGRCLVIAFHKHNTDPDIDSPYIWHKSRGGESQRSQISEQSCSKVSQA